MSSVHFNLIPWNENQNKRKILVEQIKLFWIVYKLMQKFLDVSREKELLAKVTSYFYFNNLEIAKKWEKANMFSNTEIILSFK